MNTFGMGVPQMTDAPQRASGAFPALSSGRYLRGALLSPSTLVSAGVGAGIAYFASRSLLAAGGGALVGTGLSVAPYAPSSRQMSTPLMVGSLVASALGVYLMSRRKR